MDVLWTDAVLNAIADGTFVKPAKVGWHTGDPGSAGTANEATGGGYARPTLTWTDAGDEGALGASLQPATVGVAYADGNVDLAAEDYTWLSLWSASNVFLGRVPLPYTVSLAAAGTQQFSLPLGDV